MATWRDLLLDLLSDDVMAANPDLAEYRDLVDNWTPRAAGDSAGYRLVRGFRIEVRQMVFNALVAPVISYVPEGVIDPPEGHMRYAGTISIPDDIFKGLLEYTARSLKAHGFTSILFIGDSGPNQAGMQEVSESLNREWSNEPSRILFVSDWYTSSAAFISWLTERGETEESIGTHAGLYDTALLLAVAPEHVRLENMSVGQGMDIDGVFGDPTRASAEIGDVGLDIMHEAAMNQIERLMAE